MFTSSLKPQPSSLSGLFDDDFVHLVALGDGVDDVLAFEDLAEYAVLAVEPVGDDVGDKELAAVGVGPGVGHGQHARLVVLLGQGAGFIVKFVARVARARALRAAGLNHEVGDHAVKGQAIVEAVLGELDEVARGLGAVLGEQFNLDVTFVGLDRCGSHGGVFGVRVQDRGSGSMYSLQAQAHVR